MNIPTNKEPLEQLKSAKRLFTKMAEATDQLIKDFERDMKIVNNIKEDNKNE